MVQKHRARRLHYDFRLELDGVLKSWAVPKGPPLDPKEKRLARRVEDHPLEYRDFEGRIAEGNYGAGEVIIWDEGTYHAPGVTGLAENERLLRGGLERGDLKFVLEGQRLKGEFALVQMKGKEPDNWLLIKKKDEFSRPGGSLEQDTSVRSGKTLEDLGQAKARPGSSGPAGAPTDPAGLIDELVLGGARRAAMPAGVQPMLASLTSEPFDQPGWLYELKWDGFRAIAEVRREAEGGWQASLYSRTGTGFEREFAPLVRDLKKLGFEAVLDGEIVVVDEQGRAEFRLLQRYRKTGEGILAYYVFDLLYLEGYDLQGLPLARRKEILRQVLPSLRRIKYSDHVLGQGVGLYRLALENGLEGVIAKDGASPYRQGVRGTEWLKFKTHHRQEAVIGGFTEPRGSRPDLGALLLGVYEGKDLVYVGHTGGGFADADLAEVHARLKPLERKTSPFKRRPPKTNAAPTWVEPELVCEVRFADWTEEGLMRQPVYMGLREDKAPQQVRREQPLPPAKALQRKKLIRKNETKEVLEIDGHPVTLSNPNKLYWPEEAITKREMIEYYRQVAEVILPYLKDRPESLHRFPNGIAGKSFFQKDVDDAPDWVETVKVESEKEAVDYLVCQDEATLVYMANLGTIEINPWNSRVKSLDAPDYLVIDLDPEGRSFDDVVRVARAFREILDRIQAPGFVKTSGQSGLHIYVPLGARYDYEQTRQFALLLNQLVHLSFPDQTSLERSPQKRRGKIYLDYLQNRKGQTMAAPYSLRPKPGAPVSTPLKWEEVQPGLDPRSFNIKNTLRRLEQVGDLWEGLFEQRIEMAASLSLLQEQWQEAAGAVRRS